MKQITMQRSESEARFSSRRWDIAILGEEVDERGAASRRFARDRCDRVIECSYDTDSFSLIIDGTLYGADRAGDAFSGVFAHQVLLETTTLGFPEIFLACQAAHHAAAQSVSMLYVEPKEYTAPRDQLLRRRDFELSDEVPGFRPIPGATVLLEDRGAQRGVFFLGYEERRLDRALEDHPIVPSRAAVVFGVPAFQPGWEMDSFANNVRVLRDRSVSGGVHFCGAQNPYAAYQVLEQIKLECAQIEDLFIAPLGTKPHGIGAALFVAENPGVGILYDHPKRRQKRTSYVSSWHLFDTSF